MTYDDAFTLSGDWSGQLVATAIHAGHDLRPEVADMMVLDEAVRLREEDPFTDRIGAGAPARVVAHRSRFEVDLNRPRDTAVYRTPQEAWDLEVWRENPLDDELVAGSLEVYDAFYAALGRRLDAVAARGPFVVYDVHSYNHRREGEDGSRDEADVEGNPEVNLGTGTVDGVFRPVVEAFALSLGEQSVRGHQVDVRENVKFEGRALAWWVHERYAGVGVCLALEFKKTFMDEWEGTSDHDHLASLERALTATHAPVLEALAALSGR